MSLVQNIIESGASRERLQFGHNTNIIISSIDTDVRRFEGLPTSQNTFIKLDKVDPEDRTKILASTEISFFNINPEKPEFALGNYEDQYQILGGIVNALKDEEGVEDYEEAFYSKLDEEFGEETEVTTSLLCNKKKKGAKVIIGFLQEAFMEVVGDCVGDKCPLLQCNMGANNKGYINPKNEITWILTMDSDAKLSKVTSYARKKFEEAIEKRTQTRQSEKPKNGKGGAAEEFDDVDIPAGSADEDEEGVEEVSEEVAEEVLEDTSEEVDVTEDDDDDFDAL